MGKWDFHISDYNTTGKGYRHCIKIMVRVSHG